MSRTFKLPSTGSSSSFVFTSSAAVILLSAFNPLFNLQLKLRINDLKFLVLSSFSRSTCAQISNEIIHEERRHV
ncbi:hypothetical protein EG68_00308 [Paragonimus skrjabini miyazakii]|uniref:Uncharacterized protein n=1 Tax=Paragonimus skrjabini miyazakii TaxID=59628 RepID=A0A8S9ZAJ4_9TREM|nr:hypothetical protein EG68_00308 [Paragonimus skrjabini miyazakii]